MHHALITEICDKEPLSLEDALAHDQRDEAMKSELESIYKNTTWELCDLRKGRKAIATKWIYKVACNVDGRATVATDASKGWKVHQLDIKTTSLNGELE